MELETVTLKEIEKYLEKMGKKGAHVLSILGKLNKNLDAVLNTEIGNQLLQKDILRAEQLLFKIANNKADDEEKAEFRYLFNRRIPDVAEDIKNYLKYTQVIKEAIKNANQP